MPIRIHYYIVLFIPFFILFYSESFEIGGLRISQLWKIPLLGCIIYYLFQNRWKKSPVWTQAYYWLALKHLVNANCIKDLFANIQTGITFLFLPLLYNFFQNIKSKDIINNLLLCFCQYFVLTNIPFLFLGLKMQRQGLTYGDMVGYTGIFQNQHAMSTIMGICIIVIIYYFKREYFQNVLTKLYNVCLLILAAYAMYLGFARTGWAMCFIGVVVLFLPRNIRVKQWLGIFSIMLVLLVGFITMMRVNENFRDRILDINRTTGKQQRIGSGRVDYINYAFELYASGNALELAFGKSMTALTDYEYKKTGLHIYAHNGFVTLLTTDGVIGLVIKLIAMGGLLVFICKRKKCFSFNCALAFWIMNLSYQLTQGGHVFHSDLLYALMFCILQFEYEDRMKQRMENLDRRKLYNECISSN